MNVNTLITVMMFSMIWAGLLGFMVFSYKLLEIQTRPDTALHSCVLQCMKQISRGRETAILKCRGCGAVMTVRLDSVVYASWKKFQREQKK